MLVVSFYSLAALLASVFGPETKPRNAISKTAAAENPLAGKVAHVRLLQKLYWAVGCSRVCRLIVVVGVWDSS